MRTFEFGPTIMALVLCALLPLPAQAEDPFLRRNATVEVVQKVGPAVVNITTEQIIRQQNPFGASGADPFFDRFFNDFFEPRASRKIQSLGSGVIIDGQRHVLTNEHVIRQASRIRVALADGREFDAKLVGSDPNNDIAVLQIESDEKLPWIEPGRSSDLMVGEPVIAIGNPFGLSNTVTTGVLSALDRSLRTEHGVYHGFLQTDASINPGNSGGPLMNAAGQLIGINTAIYSEAQGIGFAIPIDVAQRIVSELITHGAVAPVSLGLELQDLPPNMRTVMNLPGDFQGALIRGVQPKSPADKVGLVRGEIITRFEGHPVLSARDFYEELRRVTQGQKLTLEVRAEQKTRRVSAVAARISPELIGELAVQRLGMQFAPLQGGGYEITKVRKGAAAAQAGIEPGDFLIAVNGRVLEDKTAFTNALLDLRGRSRALIVVQRARRRYHLTLPLF